MRPGAHERARLFIASPKTPRAIAGQGGDRTTYGVACTLAVDFALEDGDVRELLGVYNRTKCDPVWSERDMERFVRSARRTANGKPGEVGKLLDVDRENYTGPRSPANNAAASSAAKPSGPKPGATSPGAPPQGGSPPPRAAERTARTVRTPLFSIRCAGEGAEPRTARTVRTLPAYSLPLSSPSFPTFTDKSKKEVSERSGERKPRAATKDASGPSVKSVKGVPAEPVDVTYISADGDVWKTPWRQPQRYWGNLNTPRK